MSDYGSFAFTVHPRAELRADAARVWPPLGILPERALDAALRRLPLPALPMAGISIGGERVGTVLCVAYGARHMLADLAGARERVIRAVDQAAAHGARLAGLGALTAPVTAGGMALKRRADIDVTNGNAYTAAIIEDQIRMLLPHLPRRARPHRVAIVGASGSVGSAVTRLLARDPDDLALTLIARTAPRLNALADSIRPQVDVRVAQSLDALRESDLVVVLTASADTVVEPHHLAPGAVVLDATQPRNTTPDLSRRRPDVLVIDGGIVSIPSLALHGGDLDLPRGRAYACFAETAVLALTGHRGHFSIGAPTVAQVDEVRSRAAGLSHLGFGAAPPTSFGRPVTLDARATVLA